MSNTDLHKLTHTQLIIAEHQARIAGDLSRAETAQRLRWEGAMGMIVNSENTAKRKDR